MIERAFHAMGTELHVYVGEATESEMLDPMIAAISAEAQLIDFDRRLSRFREDSELSRLNRDPREEVPASVLLRRAVRAGVWAAEQTDGLVDPTLVPQLVATGYATSRDGVGSPPSPRTRRRPHPAPGAPDPQARWRAIDVLDDAD